VLVVVVIASLLFRLHREHAEGLGQQRSELVVLAPV
jgi:hypothetical protein